MAGAHGDTASLDSAPIEDTIPCYYKFPKAPRDAFQSIIKITVYRGFLSHHSNLFKRLLAGPLKDSDTHSLRHEKVEAFQIFYDKLFSGHLANDFIGMSKSMMPLMRTARIPTMGPIISSINIDRLVGVRTQSAGTATSWAIYDATVPNRETGAEPSIRILVTWDIPGGVAWSSSLKMTRVKYVLLIDFLQNFENCFVEAKEKMAENIEPVRETSGHNDGEESQDIAMNLFDLAARRS
ncbi:hypothetical protein BDU57DRAFT_578534 [Ampelomyces quisqualis]|uniref:BTB domain-containing protein n=1 Tax=Ampelomyces quisqualis TaxID=50730 RepID=A0A6A5QHT1_AMPQU|nr:hypothetical protein BDU57DRAFT_578534 [Ampelomyces quisqualis]